MPFALALVKDRKDSKQVKLERELLKHGYDPRLLLGDSEINYFID